MSTVIPLVPAQFPESGRRTLLEADGIVVEGFRYSSGIEGMTVRSEALELDVLPFTGQQIWRARIGGRDLTMRSTFEEPVASREYLESNGAYFIHCGGSAMGNPGRGDEHPLHGELPSARLGDVALELEGHELRLRGGFTSRVAFGAYFRAALSLRVRVGDTLIESHAELTNLSAEPRPLMYLAHINMLPAVGGRLVEEYEPGRRPVARGDVLVGGRPVPAADLDSGDVGIEELLAPGVRVEPELVQTVPVAHPGGWSTVRQVHPTGHTDIVSFEHGDLTHTIRWLRRSADDDAFGFALPATAEADGLAAETAKGHVRLYGPGESLRATIRHGSEPATPRERSPE